MDRIGDTELRAFLGESLALWQVAGSVRAGCAPCVALIETPQGLIVRVERAPLDSPFRWFAIAQPQGFAGTLTRTRPCGSLVGLLNALRAALAIERGSAIRIAPQDGVS